MQQVKKEYGTLSHIWLPLLGTTELNLGNKFIPPMLFHHTAIWKLISSQTIKHNLM